MTVGWRRPSSETIKWDFLFDLDTHSRTPGLLKRELKVPTHSNIVSPGVLGTTEVPWAGPAGIKDFYKCQNNSDCTVLHQGTSSPSPSRMCDVDINDHQHPGVKRCMAMVECKDDKDCLRLTRNRKCIESQCRKDLVPDINSGAQNNGPEESTDFQDNFTRNNWPFWACGGVFLAILIFVFFRWRKRRQRNKKLRYGPAIDLPDNDGEVPRDSQARDSQSYYDAAASEGFTSIIPCPISSRPLSSVTSNSSTLGMQSTSGLLLQRTTSPLSTDLIPISVPLPTAKVSKTVLKGSNLLVLQDMQLRHPSPYQLSRAITVSSTGRGKKPHSSNRKNANHGKSAPITESYQYPWNGGDSSSSDTMADSPGKCYSFSW